MNTPENEKINDTDENAVISASDGTQTEQAEVTGEIKEAENMAEEAPGEIKKAIAEEVPEDTKESAAQEEKTEEPQERPKRKKAVKPLWIVLSVTVILAVAVVVYIVFFGTQKPFENVLLEAGEVPEAKMFFEGEVPEKAAFSPGLSQITADVPGEYRLDITVGKKTYKSILTVEDTVAPVLTVQENAVIWSTVLPEPSRFIEEIADKTDVTLAWVLAPALEAEGDYSGRISATDLGGNKVEADITFALIFDRQAPAFEGIKDIEAFIGSAKPDYMEGVSATDDKTENVIIEFDDSAVDTTTEGKYTVIYKAYDLAGNVTQETATVTVVEDKTAPVIGNAKNCSIILGADFDVASYIKVTDNWDKNVKLEITGEIDSSTYGQYPVSVRATDFSGNASEASFTVTVATDTVAPVIVPTDIWVYEGDTVSYRKSVTVTDNFYGTPKLTIDSSEVNLSVIGYYTVKYTATDASGNSCSATAPVYVIRRPSMEELVSDMADKVLSKIVNDNMTTLEKIYAVYRWVNKNVRYVGTSDKSNYIAGAYEGLSTGRGDCYTYYAVARVLLDKLGVQNTEMMRVNPKSLHYWNLVNLGNGWYHFDCSYFIGGNELLFMLTDEEIYAWDDLYYKAEHRFDTSLPYPERATESMQYVVDYSAKKIVKEVIMPEQTAQ